MLKNNNNNDVINKPHYSLYQIETDDIYYHFSSITQSTWRIRKVNEEGKCGAKKIQCERWKATEKNKSKAKDG